MAFTQKFSIPPANKIPPQPPKVKSEPAPLPQDRRRPRNFEATASEQIERWEGKNFVRRTKIGGLEGNGKFMTNFNQFV